MNHPHCEQNQQQNLMDQNLINRSSQETQEQVEANIQPEDTSFTLSSNQNPLSPLEQLLDKVNGEGRFQLISFLVFCMCWLVAGWLLLGGDFIFGGQYECYTLTDPEECKKFICSFPAEQRPELIKSHDQSIIFEFSPYMICGDNGYKKTILQSLIFVGSLVGFFLIPYIADNWGRLVAMKTSWMICTLGVVCLTISDSVNMVGMGYFFAGMGCNPAITLCYSFLTEQCLGASRQKYGVLIQVALAIGEGTIGLFFYAGLTWREVFYGITAFVLLTNVALFYLIETPKFLFEKSRKQALKVLNQIAVRNKRPLIQAAEIEELDDIEDQESGASLASLFKYKSLRKITFAAGFTFLGIQVIYYSTIFNLNSAGYSKIINQEIIAASEITGYITAEIFINKLRRKKISLIGMGISAAMCIVLAILTSFKNDSNQHAFTLMETVGLIINRLVLCAFWSIFYVYIAELFPTKVRSLGYGWCSTLGTIGSSASPYIIFLANDIHVNTWLFPGIIGFLSFGSLFFLPETYGEPLKDEIDEERDRRIQKQQLVLSGWSDD